AERTRAGACAFLSRSWMTTPVIRPGRCRGAAVGTVNRLATKAAPRTRLTTIAVQPTTEAPKARLPVASKKTGLFAIEPRTPRAAALRRRLHTCYLSSVRQASQCGAPVLLAETRRSCQN